MQLNHLLDTNTVEDFGILYVLGSTIESHINFEIKGNTAALSTIDFYHSTGKFRDSLVFHKTKGASRLRIVM